MEKKNFDLSTIFATLCGAVLMVLILYTLLNGSGNVSQSTSEESAPVETSPIETITEEVTTMETTESTTIEVTTQETPSNENYNDNSNVTENVGNPEINVVVNGSQVEVTNSPTDDGNGVYNIVVN